MTLEGTVERVTFASEASGFRVIKVSTPDGLVAVTGRMQPLAEGTKIRASGRYETDPRHGLQFRADTVLAVEPDTQEGLERYLGSGLIPGVGKSLATRIVKHFGDRTLKVLDQAPERLAEVSGVGKARVKAIGEAWQAQRAQREVMVFLQGHGVSAALAIRVFKRYEGEAIRIVSETPYRLALDIWGIGFRKADEIAQACGIKRDSPQRIQAAVLHALEAASERGHVFLPKSNLAIAAEQIAEVDPVLVTEALSDVCASPEARQEELSEVGTVVYRAHRFVEESGLAFGLARIAAASVPVLRSVDRAIQTFEQNSGTSLAPEQVEAVRSAAKSSVMVITGGPGVGKTTLVRALLELYRQERLLVRMAAPTGRASRRMSEATGVEAATVHRLLEFDPRSGRFLRNESNPVAAAVVIVDETSMLDQTLALALVRAIATGCRLVLVGDVDQLPSIGPGAVLKDVIHSGVLPCIRLTQIFRQAQGSAIVTNAHKIREGRPPEESIAGGPVSDFYVIHARSGEHAADLVQRLVVERIPAQFGFNPVREVQVLTPMKKGPAGAEVLNSMLQEKLNSGNAAAASLRGFRIGDKVMQLRNDYEREVFNGDLGFVRGRDPSTEQLMVEIEGRDVVYEATQLDELTLAYACSIHKSQGSEYPAVVIPMVSSHFVMLSRNLLYTAVTRGKRLVVLVTDKRALHWALEEERKEDRYTYLWRRLRDAVQS